MRPDRQKGSVLNRPAYFAGIRLWQQILWQPAGFARQSVTDSPKHHGHVVKALPGEKRKDKEHLGKAQHIGVLPAPARLVAPPQKKAVAIHIVVAKRLMHRQIAPPAKPDAYGPIPKPMIHQRITNPE